MVAISDDSCLRNCEPIVSMPPTPVPPRRRCCFPISTVPVDSEGGPADKGETVRDELARPVCAVWSVATAANPSTGLARVLPALDEAPDGGAGRFASLVRNWRTNSLAELRRSSRKSATNSQKSAHWNICCAKSRCRRLLRNVCLPAGCRGSSPRSPANDSAHSRHNARSQTRLSVRRGTREKQS